jgi:thymidylate synthase
MTNEDEQKYLDLVKHIIENGNVQADDSQKFKPSLEPNEEEQQYLNLIRDVIANGNKRMDRTGTGTLSVFGRSLRFDLEKSFPLLTTKKLPFKTIVCELLWFISGSTDVRKLQEQKCFIWDANTTRDALDKRGLQHYREFDAGAIYPFQWRHWGAEYKGCEVDYTGQGIDQITNLVKTIKTNPTDRRMLLTAYNVADISKMALPPCHCFAQFYVNDGRLSCMMYQRSADLGLGVPFNISSYALLTNLLAQVCNLKPGELIHTMADCHIYMNHIEPLKEQLTREPRLFPKLRLNRMVRDITAFTVEDCKLEGYSPHPKIVMQMSV